VIEDISDSYRILDLSPGATLEEVKRSYRELVRVWHPDSVYQRSKTSEEGARKVEVDQSGLRANLQGRRRGFTPWAIVLRYESISRWRAVSTCGQQRFGE
jgi:DnaJ domain